MSTLSIFTNSKARYATTAFGVLSVLLLANALYENKSSTSSSSIITPVKSPSQYRVLPQNEDETLSQYTKPLSSKQRRKTNNNNKKNSVKSLSQYRVLPQNENEDETEKTIYWKEEEKAEEEEEDDILSPTKPSSTRRKTKKKNSPPPSTTTQTLRRMDHDSSPVLSKH